MFHLEFEDFQNENNQIKVPTQPRIIIKIRTPKRYFDIFLFSFCPFDALSDITK